jgi:hypothetical protein
LTSPGLGLHLQFDELIPYSLTKLNIAVTLQLVVTRVHADGTATARCELSDSRTIVATVFSTTSRGGGDRPTVVLAVESATRELEPTSSNPAVSAPEQEWPTDALAPVGEANVEAARESDIGSITLSTLEVHNTTYRLLRSCPVQTRPGSESAIEFVVEGFAPEFIGQGESAAHARSDWLEQVHSSFQHIYRKMPFEMTPAESAKWSVLENVIDVEASSSQRPLVLRQIGRVSKVRHYPVQVTWVDGKIEAVEVSTAPAEFAGLPFGQWFEALVERDFGTGQIRRILNVSPVEPMHGLSSERLGKLWESLPTTASLPTSARDWTKK